MTTHEAILRALDAPVDSHGAGRLCQELLSEVTGLPITYQAPEPIYTPGFGQVGNQNALIWRSGALS